MVGHGQKDTGANEPGRVAYQDGNRAAGPPEGGKNPDKHEGQKDISHGENAFSHHGNELSEGKALSMAIKKKEAKAKGQGEKDVLSSGNADEKREGKGPQDNPFQGCDLL